MPGLLTLTTNLKSLKFGSDKPGGGDSGQPYITSDIPSGTVTSTNFDDGLIRGGAVGAAAASLTDTKRIAKFLADAPKGPLFLVKQVGLQLSNPRLEIKQGLSGLSDITSGDLSSITGGLLEPTRLYNLGINTLAQIPTNAFGVHLNRHGLVPVQDDSTKYLSVAQFNNVGNQDDMPTNRLVMLKNKLNINKPSVISPTLPSFITNAISSGLKLIGVSLPDSLQNNMVIDDYSGGPGSTYGIGNTLIKRYDITGGTEGEAKNPNQILVNKNYYNALGVSNQYDVNNISNPTSQNNMISADGTSIAENNVVSDFIGLSPSNKKYQDLINQIKSQQSGSIFPNTLNGVGFGGYDSTNKSVSYTNGYGETISISGSWGKLNRENRVGSGRQDQINLTPLFTDKIGTHVDTINIEGQDFNIRDLVKFRIESINNANPSNAVWMIFRAYLTQLTDNVDAEWVETKYAGRGEKFFIYSGFGRKINIGFKVAALSADEMQPVYQKLNYLMGQLMPDYGNDQLLMKGNMVRMTVGNWLDGQLGILNSLSYTVPNDSPWEIGLPAAGVFNGTEPLILPHIVEVSMTFTPIGSQTNGQNRLSQKSSNTSHIAQNWNGGKGTEQNWINPKDGDINKLQPTQRSGTVLPLPRQITSIDPVQQPISTLSGITAPTLP
jgi:hypothetical protein